MSLDIEKIKRELKNNPGIMLDELAKKIGDAYREYGLGSENIKKLLQSKTWESLEELKNILHSSEWKEMSDSEMDKLLTIIKWGKEFIKSLSKKEIEELKWALSQIENFVPDEDMYLTVKYLPKNLIYRAQNPSHLWDHITWACLWIANSTQMVIDFLLKLGKWIIQSPYHIYLITKWEAQYDGFKRI